jgi:hypothetical protein
MHAKSCFGERVGEHGHRSDAKHFSDLHEHICTYLLTPNQSYSGYGRRRRLLPAGFLILRRAGPDKQSASVVIILLFVQLSAVERLEPLRTRAKIERERERAVEKKADH